MKKELSLIEINNAVTVEFKRMKNKNNLSSLIVKFKNTYDNLSRNIPDIRQSIDTFCSNIDSNVDKVSFLSIIHAGEFIFDEDSGTYPFKPASLVVTKETSKFVLNYLSTKNDIPIMVKLDSNTPYILCISSDIL